MDFPSSIAKNLRLGAFGLSLIFLALSASDANAFGGHGYSGKHVPLWGEFGFGPHHKNHSIHQADIGYPWYTHPMYYTVETSYFGPTHQFTSGYPAYGRYTGVLPFPDAIAPNLGNYKITE